MEAITRTAITAHTLATAYVAGCFDRFRRTDDRGQASVEYAGIMFVVVALIAVLVGAKFTGVADALSAKISDAISKVGGK
jgi:Flp pilus assembly pilin Flp